MKNKVYCQLFSLLKTNLDELLPSLRIISEIGYDGVELMGCSTGGLELKEYIQLLNDLKLNPISSHNLKNEKDFEIAQRMGVRYTDIRVSFKDHTRDTILREAEKMNEEGRLRAKYGMKAVLHNHSEEFRWVEGEENINRIYDVLIQNTDPEYVGFEFDVGWGAFAGADPVEYVRKYAGRFPLIHVKEVDRIAKNDDELEHFPKGVLEMGAPVFPKNPNAAKTGILKDICYFTEAQAKIMYEGRAWNGRLGEGIINWPLLIEECEKQGTEAYINEREYFDYPGGNNDVKYCVREDYEYLCSILDGEEKR